jgi:hypothetical protein
MKHSFENCDWRGKIPRSYGYWGIYGVDPHHCNMPLVVGAHFGERKLMKHFVV